MDSLEGLREKYYSNLLIDSLKPLDYSNEINELRQGMTDIENSFIENYSNSILSMGLLERYLNQKNVLEISWKFNKFSTQLKSSQDGVDLKNRIDGFLN